MQLIYVRLTTTFPPYISRYETYLTREIRRYKEEDVISHINAVFVEYDYESRRPLRSLVASEPFLQQRHLH